MNLHSSCQARVVDISWFCVGYLETSFDGLDTTRWVTGHALQEEQTRLFVQDRVRGSKSEMFTWNSFLLNVHRFRLSVYFVFLFLLKTWWLCTCMYGRWHTPWCTASTRFLCASAEISLKTRFRDIAHIVGRFKIHLSWWVGCCRQWRRLCQAPQRGTRANAEIGECLSLKAG